MYALSHQSNTPQPTNKQGSAGAYSLLDRRHKLLDSHLRRENTVRLDYSCQKAVRLGYGHSLSILTVIRKLSMRTIC